MDNSSLPSFWVKQVDDEMKGESGLPAICQPQTPIEPIEFLSRSWSLSANQIAKAFATKQQTQSSAFDNNNYLTVIPEAIILPQHTGKVTNLKSNQVRGGAIGKLFHNHSSSTDERKDKERTENAHIHALLSVAGLAAALAASASLESSTKMSVAIESATQLLASYCIELAESQGAEHEHISSVVRSALAIHSPSDLLTLTAAAATALRGEATLKARLPKDAKRSASISPYEKEVMTDVQSPRSFNCEVDLPCLGDLLQITGKGVLRWKHVSVYIDKKRQVIGELKSKHVGGAFSKKHKCIVYGVIHECGGWPFKKERENMEMHFGLKTDQGLLEFKCKSKIHRQRWVDGIQQLLQHTKCIQEIDSSLKLLNINRNI